MSRQSSLTVFSKLSKLCSIACICGTATWLLAGCFDIKSVLNSSEISADGRMVRAAKQQKLDSDRLLEFGTKEHKIKVYPPPGFLYSEVEAPFGKVFSFTGNTKKEQNSKPAVININIIVKKPGDPEVKASKVLELLLTPYHNNCLDYFDERMEAFVLKGRTFRGTKFSGNYGGYYQIKGLAYCTAVENGFITILVQDKDTLFPHTEKVFRSFFDSMEIEY